ncbi:hypothetical protein [Cupriavidus plantarum]|uniref:hypothetical protein n=1 Tax=Cupriavidus plantarum TaxID=942865 RepID=UPI001B1B3CBC|nr:hypothetical protein [Cupriavidus plantarum]CAG2150296.1 hypothetical protein LMG26296_04699 [Cupriavidus plantarum]SMR67977.1 hypothetical protein SAMN05421735_2886 [Cupriavidus plantarum]
MSYGHNPYQQENAGESLSNPPGRPRTPAEKYDEMMRRRAYFQQRIAEYDATRVEPEEPAYVMW